jgi:hypothetical protein
MDQDTSTDHAESNPKKKVDVAVEKTAPVDERLGKIKLAFLYILIGGLIVSALISVFAILIGEFNDVIRKALATTFIFVTHSLIILGLVSTDRHNQIGRALMPTVILGTVLANMVTMTFGTWDIWSDEISWRALALYILLIGSSFIIAGLLKLRLAHKATTAVLYTTLALIVLWTLLLVPWIFIEVDLLDQLYFRLVGAVTILAATALSVAVIVRRIAISQHPELKATVPASEPFSRSMAATIITIGTIVALAWFIGFFLFLISAAQANY